MKRILFFASDNTIESGAFNSMTKLCSIIQASGRYEPIVILPNLGDGYTLLKKYGIKYHYVRSCRWIVKKSKKNSPKTLISNVVKKCINFHAYYKLLRLVKKLNVDAVHLNTLHTYIGAKVAKNLGKPLIWHFRELLDEDQGAWFWNDRYPALLNQADCCIAISEYVYHRFQNIVDRQRLVMIPNGIDEVDFYTKRTYTPQEKLRIICVGNINGHKGHETLIRACDLLLKRNVIAFKVDLVGAGIKERDYKTLCSKLKLEAYITFNGRHRDVKRYYDRSDVMIMGSDAEAFGRTTVEAMMCGCAVVGSDSGATPSILEYGKYGFMFPKGDQKKLADILQRLIENREEMFNMAMNGQKYALETYTANRNAEKVMQLYERIGI